MLQPHEKTNFLLKVSREVLHKLRSQPFQFDREEQAKEPLFRKELEQVAQLGSHVIHTFYAFLPGKGEGYKMLTFFDELDDLCKHHSFHYSAAFTYLFLHMAHGIMTAQPCQMLGAGKMPNLLKVSRDEHFMRYHGFYHGSPDRIMDILPMNTLEEHHVQSIVENSPLNSIPMEDYTKSLCAELTQEVTQGVPRFVKWTIDQLVQACRKRNLSLLSDLVQTIYLDNSLLREYGKNIASYIRSDPLPFLTLSTACLLGCRLNPASHLDADGRISTMETPTSRPVVDWCKLFNYYVDYESGDFITLRFPLLLSYALSKHTTFNIVPYELSREQEMLFSKRQQLLSSCYSYGTVKSPNSFRGHDFTDEAMQLALKSQLPLTMYGVAESNATQGGRFESMVFRVLHLRLVDFSESWGDRKPIGAVLPFPHNVGYNPRVVKMANLPKIMAEKANVTPFIQARTRIESIMAPCRVKKPSYNTVQIYRGEFGLVANLMEDNTIYQTAALSSSADMYWTVGGVLIAFNKNFKKYDLSLIQIAREMKKALPEELINSDRFQHEDKYFVNLCTIDAATIKQLREKGATKMTGGWYLEGPATVPTGGEVSLKIPEMCTFICLDQKEIALTFSHFMDGAKDSSLNVYYDFIMQRILNSDQAATDVSEL